jgi:hypothetical protein
MSPRRMQQSTAGSQVCRWCCEASYSLHTNWPAYTIRSAPAFVVLAGVGEKSQRRTSSSKRAPMRRMYTDDDPLAEKLTDEDQALLVQPLQNSCIQLS